VEFLDQFQDLGHGRITPAAFPTKMTVNIFRKYLQIFLLKIFSAVNQEWEFCDRWKILQKRFLWNLHIYFLYKYHISKNFLCKFYEKFY